MVDKYRHSCSTCKQEPEIPCSRACKERFYLAQKKCEEIMDDILIEALEG